MKDLRAIGHFGGWLVALVALGTRRVWGREPGGEAGHGRAGRRARPAAGDRRAAGDGRRAGRRGRRCGGGRGRSRRARGRRVGHRVRAGADGWAHARRHGPAAGRRSDGGDVGHAAGAVGRRRRREIHDPEGAGAGLPDQRRHAARRRRRAGDVFGERQLGSAEPTASAIPPRSRRRSPSRPTAAGRTRHS